MLAQGVNREVSFANYPIAADGTWSGQFTIPSTAVPGLVHLNAQCFDASHAVQTVVHYAAEIFLVEQSTLNATPTSGPVATNVGLSPLVTACPRPASAGDWVVVVHFAQGGNPVVSFANYAIAADGSWAGLFPIPAAAVPGPAQLNAACFDSTHRSSARVDFAAVDFVVTSGPVATRADLAITKTAPSAVLPDTNLTYTIVATNSGPDGATNVVVTDVLPTNETFVSVSSVGAAGACATPAVGTAGGTLVCHVFSLPNAQTAQWNVVVHVAANVANATVLSNTATATADTPDPDATNNSATAQTLVMVGGGGGGPGGGGGGPGATPELDSLLLFGSGLTGTVAYALRSWRRRFRRDR